VQVQPVSVDGPLGDRLRRIETSIEDLSSYVDECTGPLLARWLRQEGHEVFSVYDDARGISDDEVMRKAVDETRIIVTNDKDFGERVFRDSHPHHGVILLRLSDERPATQIMVLRRLLDEFSGGLSNHFVVATEEHLRFARPR